ncbi:phosphoribosyltransferase [Ponticaulis sp.]|uniref:phosphoribosyltransferase n=1 Tax=Ponticaulis sp. TaxID=2020902 RepID=UPI000B642F6E|nr:phosphoribosyltransferase family protein [Ponticaulis sp.]MAI89833.1 hypoxanthine phosphoribosyltransferase [Ponticaulis sp.]OUX99508.1 MAG: hypoxanthine phosphoribosyltransferase [Hyphomonadaceae bacterium TMED5]|tara:strand:+ start:64076 stop:64606 length:531 start_codon:yes stop_codon:yes gene_type:complete
MTSIDFDVLLDETEIQARIGKLATELAPRLKGDWTAVTILLGATPFTTDLMRHLSRLDIHPMMDAIWLESYRDERESSGRVVVRADLSRSIKGRGVLLIDDVFDTGRTLAFARQHLLTKGAREVVSCVLARKPKAPREGLDAFAYDAPDRYLVGYGMDDAGLYRGLPYLGAIPDGA